MPARLDVTAARNVPWKPTLNLYYFGAPLPPITSIRMQVRLYAGAVGAALLDMNAIPHTDNAAPTDARPTRRCLTLEPTETEAHLLAMPTGLNQPEAGEADRFFHDIVVTYADAFQERLAEGDFLLSPGVTN